MAAEAARQLREMADARGVQLAIADDMPALIVDVGRLELALVNLLSNADQVLRPGQSDSASSRSPAATRPTATCEICVRDNGIGIPASASRDIFRRFTRAHADRADWTPITGVGLGLAIVDDCVIAMNGTITVESTGGRRHDVLLTLPCEPGSRDAGRAAATRAG